MNLKLAWRNTWRNKRRTFITATSVFIAIILALLMRSLQLGAYQRMIDNVVSFYTGHIQVHRAGYWDEKTLDNSFVPDTALTSVFKSEGEILNWVPRLESFALSSANELTKGALIVGVDPAAENKLTHLSHKIVMGKYLEEMDNGVLVAQGLAENLQLKTGDTLVVLGQGYHGVIAAGKYPLKGIVKFSAPDLNNGMVYMTLPEAQTLYGTGNRLTSFALSVTPGADASHVAALLKKRVKDLPVEVMDWKEMMPEMVQIIQVDNAGGIITISILYMIIGFGIFGTILMMLAERRHEFGILVAVGMKRVLLARVVLTEILIVCGLGVALGTLAGIPIISYFHAHPIGVSGELAKAYERFGLEPVFPFSDDYTIYFAQALIVFSLCVVLSIYPMLRILNLKTINALKS